MEYKIDYETHLGEEDCDLLRATEFSVSTTFGSRGPYQKKKKKPSYILRNTVEGSLPAMPAFHFDSLGFSLSWLWRQGLPL